MHVLWQKHVLWQLHLFISAEYKIHPYNTATARHMASKIAYSLAEAVRSRAIVQVRSYAMSCVYSEQLYSTARILQVLNLKGSSDLVCENVMCAKAGQSCYCRLLVALQRLPNLKELDLSNNALKEIPEILTPEVVPGLTSLSIGGNELESLPLSVLALPNLKVVFLLYEVQLFSCESLSPYVQSPQLPIEALVCRFVCCASHRMS